MFWGFVVLFCLAVTIAIGCVSPELSGTRFLGAWVSHGPFPTIPCHDPAFWWVSTPFASDSRVHYKLVWNVSSGPQTFASECFIWDPGMWDNSGQRHRRGCWPGSVKKKKKEKEGLTKRQCFLPLDFEVDEVQSCCCRPVTLSRTTGEYLSSRLNPSESGLSLQPATP